MDAKIVSDALKKAKESTKKRNFTQSYDLVIKLKNLDLKKTEEQVDLFINLHNSKSRKVKVAALVGPELKDQAEQNCDLTIIQDDFVQWSDKKKLTNLANSYDFFIAQANIMPKVAQTFGKVLGVRGKMPNPKLGCVVPPKTNLAPLIQKLNKTIRFRSRTAPMLQAAVGDEKMDDKLLIDNITSAIDQLVHALPGQENNINKIYLKTTMGAPVEIK